MSACAIPCRHEYLKKPSKHILEVNFEYSSYKYPTTVVTALIIIQSLPAKLRMPRQLVGWSCLIRNLQHASLTVAIWRIEDAGNNTYDSKWIRTINLKRIALDSYFLFIRRTYIIPCTSLSHTLLIDNYLYIILWYDDFTRIRKVNQECEG